ncbi:MAG: CBS domain-containing protein [Lentisphaerae bacterium]|nr:CBS domain-containing protein [Lentisphaerota bacterium]
MTTELLVAARHTTLREVQDIMKQIKISGVPVAENGRLYGLISIDDIIRALEGGYIDEPCQKHMSTKLVVLEDDMPLSFAISYFDRYRYGRFPVLDRNQRLVGIICQRDINRTLLVELTHELRRMEELTGGSSAPQDDYAGLYFFREFPVSKFDFENAGKAATTIKQLLQERSFPARLIRRVAVAAYELEMNMCVHSLGGVLTCQVSNGEVEIVARDTGPGIADVEWACRDGSSTANDWIRSLGFGAGLGLPNVKRVADHFEIRSQEGEGTRVRAVLVLASENKPKEESQGSGGG